MVVNLKTGSSGSDVKKLQQELINAGYNVGKTGAKTAAGNNGGGTADNGGTTDNGSGDTATVGTPAPAYTSGTYGQSDIVNQAYALLDQHNASKPGAYQSQWEAQIKEYLDKIMNRDKFSYNFNEDALYQMYKDQYIQQGQMAMMDTMGQAAAMTGGYGNSYAQTVGQQAYNQQLSELNNIIPELYQMAFDQYAYEGDQLYNQYGLLMDQENMDYGRYMDSYNMWADERDYLASRYDSERNFDYGVWSDTEDRKWNEYVYGNNMEYQQGRDQVSDQQWQTTFNEGVRQYEKGKTAGNSGNGGNNNDTTTKYTEFDYEEQAKWDKEFKSAKTSDDLERVKTRMIQAGIDPEIAESWYNDYAKGFKPVVEEAVLTDAAKAFMSNLPYAHAGSSAEAWKQTVEKKLMAQYENGTLTEEDVEAIIIKLGL